MSGRSCSVACAVFFTRDPASCEEPPYRAERDLGAVISQESLQLSQRDVRRRLVSVQDQPGMRLDPHRTSIATLLLWRRRPCWFASCCHRTALAALTPNRTAACRRDRPPAIAATTLSRRSTDNARAIHASLPHRQES